MSTNSFSNFHNFICVYTITNAKFVSYGHLFYLKFQRISKRWLQLNDAAVQIYNLMYILILVSHYFILSFFLHPKMLFHKVQMFCVPDLLFMHHHVKSFFTSSGTFTFTVKIFRLSPRLMARVCTETHQHPPFNVVQQTVDNGGFTFFSHCKTKIFVFLCSNKLQLCFTLHLTTKIFTQEQQSIRWWPLFLVVLFPVKSPFMRERGRGGVNTFN